MGCCGSKEPEAAKATPTTDANKPPTSGWDPLAAKEKRERALSLAQRSKIIASPSISMPGIKLGGVKIVTNKSEITELPTNNPKPAIASSPVVVGDQQAAVMVSGFNNNKVSATYGLDGLYAQADEHNFFQRLPPKWCLWFSTTDGGWHISADRGDTHVAHSAANVEELTGADAKWTVVDKNNSEIKTEETNVEWSSNYIIKTGFLTKSPPSGLGKGWKRRFFVLLGPSVDFGESQLLYFEDDQKVDLRNPKGSIFLESVIDVGPGVGPERGSVSGGGRQNTSNAKCVRLTLPGRVFEIVTNSPLECKMWTQSILGQKDASINGDKRQGLGIGRLKTGTLMRMPPKSKEFQKTFCTIDALSLKFFSDESESGTVKDIIGQVLIRHISKVVPVPSSAYFDLHMTKGGATVKLKAESNADAEEWIELFLSLTTEDGRETHSRMSRLYTLAPIETTDDAVSETSEQPQGDDGWGGFKPGTGALDGSAIRVDNTNNNNNNNNNNSNNNNNNNNDDDDDNNNNNNDDDDNDNNNNNNDNQLETDEETTNETSTATPSLVDNARKAAVSKAKAEARLQENEEEEAARINEKEEEAIRDAEEMARAHMEAERKQHQEEEEAEAQARAEAERQLAQQEAREEYERQTREAEAVALAHIEAERNQNQSKENQSLAYVNNQSFNQPNVHENNDDSNNTNNNTNTTTTTDNNNTTTNDSVATYHSDEAEDEDEEDMEEMLFLLEDEEDEAEPEEQVQIRDATISRKQSYHERKSQLLTSFGIDSDA